MAPRGPYGRHFTPFQSQLCQDSRSGIIRQRNTQRSDDLLAHAIPQRMTTLEISLRGLLRNLRLKVGAKPRGTFTLATFVRTVSNPLHDAATEPLPPARSRLDKELAVLERRARNLAQNDLAFRRLISSSGFGAFVDLDLHRFLSGPVLMLGGPVFEGHG